MNKLATTGACASLVGATALSTFLYMTRPAHPSALSEVEDLQVKSASANLDRDAAQLQLLQSVNKFYENQGKLEDKDKSKYEKAKENLKKAQERIAKDRIEGRTLFNRIMISRRLVPAEWNLTLNTNTNLYEIVAPSVPPVSEVKPNATN